MLEYRSHYTYGKLLKFTFPSIIMLVVSSIYYVVDGFFVSNFVGKMPFAAVNFIWPVLQLLGGFGFMFGTGGSALIGKTMGEGDMERANRIYSMVIWTSMALGVILAVLGITAIRPVAMLLGAEGELLEDSVLYGGIYMLGVPATLLQNEFQCLCATAGKPKLGLWATIAAGIANVVLDAMFIVVFRWGVAGAAIASVMGQCMGGFVPLFYLMRKNNKSLIHLQKTRLELAPMVMTCTNGFSELLNNISMSIVSMLYNVQLLKYIGEDGIAAYGVLMYVNLIFLAIFIGYSVGSAPVVSFQYGAQNHRELKSLLIKSTVIIGISSLAMFLASEWMAKPLSLLYAGYDPGLYAITLRGFFIYSFSFLFSGFAIWSASFFTALNNGVVSAMISTLRTMVFQVVGVLALPLVWGLDGIWISIVLAELLAAALGGVLILLKRKKYHYLDGHYPNEQRDSLDIPD